MSLISDVTDESFQSEVLLAEGLVLVDFWAPWCKPCRQVDTVIEELAGELGDSVKVVRINTDDNPATPQQLRVTSIPTLLIFRDGALLTELIGPRPKAALREALHEHVAA